MVSSFLLLRTKLLWILMCVALCDHEPDLSRRFVRIGSTADRVYESSDLLEAAKLFSQVGLLMNIHPAVCAFPFSFSWATLGIDRCSYILSVWWVKGYLYGGLDLHISNCQWGWTSFHAFIFHIFTYIYFMHLLFCEFLVYAFCSFFPFSYWLV